MTGLRVATYNLYLGADVALLFDAADLDQLADRVHVVRAQLAATRFEERARAVAAILARERVDLVGLQEMSRWTTTPPDGEEQVLVDFLPTLLAELDAAGAPYDAHAVNPNFGGALPVAGEGVFTLSGANVTLVRRGGPVEVVAEATGTYDARARRPDRHRRASRSRWCAAGAASTSGSRGGRCVS